MEKKQKKIRFGLFFTEGVSLQKWKDAGFLDRELKYYRALAQEIGEVTFFTYGATDVDLDGIKVVPRPIWCPSFVYSFLMPFIQYSKLRKLDIYKTNQMRGAWAAVLAKKIFKKKLIVRCGFEWLSFIEERKKRVWFFFAGIKPLVVRMIEGWVYGAADAIILTSKHDAEFVGRIFGEEVKTKVSIVPNYIDTDLFRPADKILKKNSLVYVGRFSEEKNLKNLVLAMEGLGEELTFIGDGPMRHELEKFAKKHDIVLHMPGKIPNKKLPEELSKYAVFVLPSLHEGNPKVLLEAMSCGMACVGTDVEGIRDVIQDGTTGILCGTSADAMRGAIKTILADLSMRDKIGAQARKYIMSHNLLKIILGLELDIYWRL